MRTRRSTGLCALLGAVILSAAAACDLFRPDCGPWLEVPGDPEASSSVPRVRGVPGQRLVDQVPPGEGDIEVVFHSEAPFVANFGTADEEIASIVARAEAIVVAEALRIESSLTPTEDGIESVVNMVVSEVLMSGEGPAAVIEGQHLQLRVNGGTLLVRGRRFTTRRSGEVVPKSRSGLSASPFRDTGDVRFTRQARPRADARAILALSGL